MAQQILIYWLIAQIIGLAGLPLARLLLRALPDGGYPFAKALGLLVSGWLAWMLAMLGLAPFGAGLVVTTILVVAAGGALTHREGRPRALWAWLRAHWRGVLGYEIVFTLALVYLAVQRSYEWGFVGPHPWGTERPMDFAFFNAIQRSASFPPHDPWMAGYGINYYYLGYLLMACVALLGGLPAGVGYNLSLALTFALAAQGIAGMVVALIGLSRRGRGAGRGGWIAAALTAIMVLFAGNQAGALQVITGTPAVSALSTADLARTIANGLGPRAELQLSQTYRGDVFDPEGTRTITPVDAIKDFNWWWPSRALWDRAEGADGPHLFYAITEFPFFSFWLGDMHPHVLALPFGLLAMALALNLLALPDPPAYGRGRRGWVELIGTGVALGGLYMINSWDFPTYLLLFLGALLLRYARERGAGPLGLDWRAIGRAAMPVVVGSFALYMPFFLTFKSLVGGKQPLLDLPILGALSRTIALSGWPKTPLHTVLIIFGLFAIPLLIWAARVALAGRRWSIPLGIMAGVLVAGALVGFPLLALAPLAFYLGRAALERARAEDIPAAFVLAVCGLVSLILLGTELIYIRDVFDNRMNTIFKFYYQIWLIWGTLTGYALWALLASREKAWSLEQAAPIEATSDDDAENQAGAERSVDTRRPPLALPLTVLLMTIVLLAGALVYPALTLSKLYREGVWVGLNGTNPRERSPAGAAAIAWLRQNAPGDAVIVEGVGEDPWFGYDTAGLGIGGVSSSTGLATVMGWPSHQSQWRGGDPATYALIQPRREDVVAIYSSLDAGQARALLEKYHVRYIYVGATERALYSPEGLAKLAQIATPVFEQDDVTIYQVGS